MLYVKDTFNQWLSNEKSKITNVDLVLPWFNNNQQTIMDAVNAGCRSNMHSFNAEYVDNDRYTKLDMNVQFTPFCSNTHACPENGVSNWSSDPTLPRHYKGWIGRLTGSMVDNKINKSRYPLSAAFDLVGIKTGGGGGSSTRFGYSVTLFLDDWPGLQKQVDEMEQEKMVNILKGQHVGM